MQLARELFIDGLIIKKYLSDCNGLDAKSQSPRGRDFRIDSASNAFPASRQEKYPHFELFAETESLDWRELQYAMRAAIMILVRMRIEIRKADKRMYPVHVCLYLPLPMPPRRGGSPSIVYCCKFNRQKSRFLVSSIPALDLFPCATVTIGQSQYSGWRREIILKIFGPFFCTTERWFESGKS